jgi:hypothetical protein
MREESSSCSRCHRGNEEHHLVRCQLCHPLLELKSRIYTTTVIAGGVVYSPEVKVLYNTTQLLDYTLHLADFSNVPLYAEKRLLIQHLYFSRIVL